jgi:hypothetical protein
MTIHKYFYKNLGESPSSRRLDDLSKRITAAILFAVPVAYKFLVSNRLFARGFTRSLLDVALSGLGGAIIIINRWSEFATHSNTFSFKLKRTSCKLKLARGNAQIIIFNKSQTYSLTTIR